MGREERKKEKKSGQGKSGGREDLADFVFPPRAPFRNLALSSPLPLHGSLFQAVTSSAR